MCVANLQVAPGHDPKSPSLCAGAGLQPQSSINRLRLSKIPARAKSPDRVLDAAPCPTYSLRMHEISFLVTPELAGRSLKSLALGTLKLSYTQFKRLKFSGGLLVDGTLRHSDYCPRAGESLRLVFRDDPSALIAAGSAPLRLAYEDEDLLVVDKPAPLPSVASKQGGETLENRVFSHLGMPEDFVYRPVNRLDKGTSGLMLVAKNAHIQQRMQRLLHTESFCREYLAIVRGAPQPAQGDIELPIGHGPGIRRVISPEGRAAHTQYQVLWRGEGLCLLRLRLLTGRTHQIRVHLAAMGCPVLGDFLYGQEDERLPGRFALHAFQLSFTHPITDETLSFASPLPAEMQGIINEQP